MNIWFQFIKFGLVGLSGMIIDFGSTWLLKEKVKLHPYLANSIGFSLAVVNNFTWNKYWTFQNASTAVSEQFAWFAGISIIGLLLNNLAIYLLTNRLNLHFYLAKVIATGLVMCWNFIANYQFTFHA
jgi:putative flippase GtrA